MYATCISFCYMHTNECEVRDSYSSDDLVYVCFANENFVEYIPYIWDMYAVTQRDVEC
jgi:hypothetical protein